MSPHDPTSKLRGASLAERAAQWLSPFCPGGNIEFTAAPVRIVPERAQSMALIFHELATNAIPDRRG